MPQDAALSNFKAPIALRFRTPALSPGAYGLPLNYIHRLREAIIQGTGKIQQPAKSNTWKIC
jgi:hypothetical protein